MPFCRNYPSLGYKILCYSRFYAFIAQQFLKIRQPVSKPPEEGPWPKI